jgi:hypothetical protein
MENRKLVDKDNLRMNLVHEHFFQPSGVFDEVVDDQDTEYAPMTLSDFGQSSSQSWSQPVRNDEASQTSKIFYGKNPKPSQLSDESGRKAAVNSSEVP